MKAENNCLWLKLDDDDDDWVNLMIMVTFDDDDLNVKNQIYL